MTYSTRKVSFHPINGSYPTPEAKASYKKALAEISNVLPDFDQFVYSLKEEQIVNDIVAKYPAMRVNFTITLG